MAGPALTNTNLDRLVGLPAPFLNPATPPGRSQVLPGAWQVGAYGHVLDVITNTGRWAQELSAESVPADVIAGDWEDPQWRATWTSDGDRHKQRRELIAPHFLPAAIDQLREKIEDITRDLVGRIAHGSGRFDVVSHLARPLPAQVMCHLFGIDLAAGEQLRRWVEDQTTIQAVEHVPIRQQMAEYLAGLLDARDGQGGNDIVSQLAALRHASPPYLIEGEPVSDAELIAAMWSLLAAGLGSASAGVASMFLLLAAHNQRTGCLADLRNDPALIPAAVEEVLRWDPPLWGVPVSAREDCDFAGLKVRKGDRMLALICSANRDPGRFRAPGEFDIRRSPNPHLSFARGSVHRCIGAALARLMMRTALRIVLEELGPDLRWLSEEPFGRQPAIVNQVEVGWIGFR